MKTHLAILFWTARLAAGRWFLIIISLCGAGARAAEPVFTDVTTTLAPGLPATFGASVAWGDFDNDGRVDFLLAGGGFSQLWRNTGTGFTNVTAAVAPGLPGVGGASVAWGDYDNDGRLDFLLTGGGISQVWRNTGSGFSNVTATVAPGLPQDIGSTVAWADFDNDGRLDFFIGGENSSQLWRNTGSGFTNVTASLAPGLPWIYEGSVAWGDYDNDGLIDILLTGGAPGLDSNYIPTSQLWRNTGSGFVNVTASVAPGLPGVYHSCVAWGDYDNDGRLDFLIGGRSFGATPVCQVWRNTGHGFTNVTTTLAPGLPGMDSGSVSWGDYDNDGRLDFLLTAGISQLWRNTGSGFTNVTATVAPGLPGVFGSSAAWADYDNDGRLDFVLAGSLSQLWQNNTVQSSPPPVVITDLPTRVSQTSVAFNARVNPRGQAMNAWFIWDVSTDYRVTTAAQPMGNRSSLTNVTQILNGLSPGMTYYYRAVGSNAQGQVFFGAEQQFRFAPPDVATYEPGIQATGATLPGAANLGNLPSYCWFEWGPAPALDHSTPLQFFGGASAGFNAILSGLQPGGAYYFRAAASNSMGVAYGAMQPFYTPGTNALSCASYVSPGPPRHGNGASGGHVNFWVPCAWSAISTNSWITITSDTNGPGPMSGTLIYKIAANPEPQPRSGAIVINGTPFWMTQAAGHPVIVTQPTNQSIFAGETATFNVGVIGSLPVFEWRVNGARLVDGNGVSGATTANLVLTDVQDSQAGEYQVDVGTSIGHTYSSIATLTVSCTYNLSASGASFNSGGATDLVGLVSVAPTCPWTIVNTNPWVVIASSITNRGNGTVIYALAANPTTTARSGNLLIAGQTYTISQAAGPSNTDVSLEKVLDTEGILAWDTIGTPAWFGQTLVSHDGVDAAQSGAVGDSAAVTVLSTITGPGTLSFWWKVSSETNKDYLKFFVSAVQQTRISGEVDWQRLTYTYPSGSYTSKWTYSKNDHAAVGNDRGWLDQVSFVPGPGCTSTLSHSNATHSANPEVGQVNVTLSPGCTLNAMTLSPWITNSVDPGGAFVRYYLASNSLPFTRSGTIVIAGQLFTIEQQGAPLSCIYAIWPTNQTFAPFTADTGVVTVTAHDECEWRISNTNSWITLLTDVTNSGSGQVIFSVAENTSPIARSGNVQIDGQFLYIYQWERPPCTYSINPISRPHGYGAATGTVSVTTQPGCPWTPMTTDAWITVDSAMIRSGSGSVGYSIAANPFTVSRTGTIQVGGRVYTIGQAGAPVPPICPVTLLPGNASYSSSRSTGSVSVAAAANCSWFVINTNAWISTVSGTNGTGNGSVIYVVATNSSASARSGTIRIADQIFPVTQAGAAPRLRFIHWTAGGAALSLEGEAGKFYVIQRSEDLIHWFPVLTNVAPSTVTDITAGNAPWRFYRSLQAQ